jgi:hypothetical protein
MKTESPTAIRAVLYAAAIAIAVGVLPLPYGYYSLLRVVAVLAFAYCAYVALGTRSWATLVLVALAVVVFNPVIPLHLPKDVWACIDATAATYLAILAKHVQTQFSSYAPPERTVEVIAKMLGFAVLLALLGGVGITVLAGVVIIPLRCLGLEVSGRFLNPIAYASASAAAVAVLAGYCYHSGERKVTPSEAS